MKKLVLFLISSAWLISCGPKLNKEHVAQLETEISQIQSMKGQADSAAVLGNELESKFNLLVQNPLAMKDPNFPSYRDFVQSVASKARNTQIEMLETEKAFSELLQDYKKGNVSEDQISMQLQELATHANATGYKNIYTKLSEVLKNTIAELDSFAADPTGRPLQSLEKLHSR